MPISNQAFSKRSQHVLVLTISQPSISDTLYTYNYSATMTSAGNTLRPYASGLEWKIDVVTSPGGTLVSNKGIGTYSYDFRSPNSLTATRTITGSGSFTINRPSSNSSDITYGLKFTANTALASAELIGRAISTQTVTVAKQTPPAPPPTPAPSWSTTTLNLTVRAGQQVNTTVVATNVNSSNGYSLAPNNTLPSSVTLNATSGLISGTLGSGVDAAFDFILRATGPGGATNSNTFTINRVQPLPVWSTTSMNLNAVVGQPFSTTVTASGVLSTGGYSLTSGTSLPAGITLNTDTGVISGTSVSTGPSTAFDFRVDATSSGGTVTSSTFRINRRQPLVSWTASGADSTLNTTNLRVGQAFSDSVRAINATFYTVVGLPPSNNTNMVFTSTSSLATVSGTPNSTGSFSFSITASNADGVGESLSFTFAPKPALPVWTDQTLAITSIAKGKIYTDGVSATSANAYLVTSGALPPGLTLNTSSGAIGALNQFPTTVGVYNFVIRARNSINEQIFTNNLTITVTPAGSGSVWNGSTWVQAPFKVWNGTTWIEASAKAWNGTTWIDPIAS